MDEKWIREIIRSELKNWMSNEGPSERANGKVKYSPQKKELILEDGRKICFKHQYLLSLLFESLIKQKGQFLSKEDIVEILWQESYDPGRHDNKLFVCIKRLRNLIEPNPKEPIYILKNRQGYGLNPWMNAIEIQNFLNQEENFLPAKKA